MTTHQMITKTNRTLPRTKGLTGGTWWTAECICGWSTFGHPPLATEVDLDLAFQHHLAQLEMDIK